MLQRIRPRPLDDRSIVFPGEDKRSWSLTGIRGKIEIFQFLISILPLNYYPVLPGYLICQHFLCWSSFILPEKHIYPLHRAFLSLSLTSRSSFPSTLSPIALFENLKHDAVTVFCQMWEPCNFELSAVSTCFLRSMGKCTQLLGRRG